MSKAQILASSSNPANPNKSAASNAQGQSQPQSAGIKKRGGKRANLLTDEQLQYRGPVEDYSYLLGF